MGMGRALRTGFEKSEGDILVTIDADLSYSPSHINKLVSELLNDETIDIAVGSPYMEGGSVKNVPFSRLFISKAANKFVGFSMTENLSTVTSVLRAYRREVLESMDLESNGTNINLEILSKAIATRYKIKEVPALLEGRELGSSKLKFRSKTISHVLFLIIRKADDSIRSYRTNFMFNRTHRWNLFILSVYNWYIRPYKTPYNIFSLNDNLRNSNINFWICSHSNKPS